MQKFKKDILLELKFYWKKKDELKKEFESWNDKNRYSQDFILKKQTERNFNLGQLKHDLNKNLDKILNDKLETIKPNHEKIDSIEYQTKLANVLKLMELSAGKLEKQYFDFMVEANDTDTINILASKYNTNALIEAKINADLESIKKQYIFTGNNAKNYSDYEEKGIQKDTIIDMFN